MTPVAVAAGVVVALAVAALAGPAIYHRMSVRRAKRVLLRQLSRGAIPTASLLEIGDKATVAAYELIAESRATIVPGIPGRAGSILVDNRRAVR